jgi:hypothetical protein
MRRPGERIPYVLIAAIAAAVIACGGDDSSNKTPDAASHVDAFSSTCGMPGDTGNDVGVGKFCESLADCSGNMSATLCSSFGDPTTHFCTKTCASTGSAGQCGSNASCECNASNQCGCTPNSCLGSGSGA